MFKKQIYKKGLYKAPEELEVKILLQAAEKLNFSEKENDNWLEYAGWIPFIGLFLLLKNLLVGQRFTISPTIKI